MNQRIQHTKGIFKKIVKILIGTLIYSAGISLFLDPNGLAPGGVVGISVIISHAFGGTTGNWYFILNVPIILLGWWKFGGKFIISSFFAIICSSTFTNLFSVFGAVTENLLLASIAGSIMTGVGISVVLQCGSTTGGMDIIVKILRKKYPAIKTSTLFMTVDITIVAIAGIVFSDFNLAMYAFIAVVLSGKVMDYVLYGQDEARLVYIVSDKADILLKRILEEMEIGATILTGRGAYSQNEKNIIMCVVKKPATPKLEDIVKQEDNRAFMIVTSANEIYGEGYKNILSEKL